MHSTHVYTRLGTALQRSSGMIEHLRRLPESVTRLEMNWYVLFHIRYIPKYLKLKFNLDGKFLVVTCAEQFVTMHIGGS